MTFRSAAVLLLCLSWISFVSAETKEKAVDSSRVIVLGGAVGETVYALGAGSKVIAADLSCTFPEEITKLPKVGYHRQISAEGLLALKPTLILATDVAGPPAAIEQLKASGVPLIIVSHAPEAATVIANIRRLADVLGLSDKGESLVKKVESELAAAAAGAGKTGEGPKVLFLMGAPSADRLNAAGKKTAAAEIVRLAGGRLVFEEFEGYKAVSPESIAAAGPDVILFPSSGTHGEEFSNDWTKLPAIAGTPAVKNKRVYPIDLGLMAGFGPRVGEAASELHKILYQK